MKHTFASDNFSGVHPEVMEALHVANVGHAMAYGHDEWTKRAEALFKEMFGKDAEVYFVPNGTGANVCAIKHLLVSWQAVVCADSAHVWTDETGAVQEVSGSALLPVKAKNGKVTPESLHEHLHFRGSEHHVQPHAITITQSTELGTVYTLEELKAIGEFARREKLLLHMDGARLSNAAAALNVSLKAMTTDIGVDVLSFGGTKNGLMGAEAVVFLKPGLGRNFLYARKQHLQLVSKMRFMAAQFIALLEGDLWLRNAKHANQMAKLLESRLRKDFPQLPILYPVESNAVFVQLPHDVMMELQKQQFFWIWDESISLARWMTGWDTKPEYIDEFLSALKKLLS